MILRLSKPNLASLLVILFYFNIFVMPINIVGTYITGKGLSLHFAYYIFLILLIPILLLSHRKMMLQTFPQLFCLQFVFYLVVMSFPLTILYGLGLGAIISGFRWIMIPFILYFIMLMALKSKTDLDKFFRAIILGAVFVSCYSIVEVLNNILNFWPVFSEAIYTYLEKVSPDTINRWGTYVKYIGFQRPYGVFVNVHSSAFFMAAGLIVVVSVGNNVGFHKWSTTVFSIIILAGLLFSFSRLYVVVIVLMLYILLATKSLLFGRKNGKQMDGKLWLLISILSILSVVILVQAGDLILKTYSPLFDKSTRATSHIVGDNILDLFKSGVPKFIKHSPTKFFFGVGFLRTKEQYAIHIPRNAEGLTTGELHNIRHHLCTLGLFGFSFYLVIFSVCFWYLWCGIKLRKKRKALESSFYICAILLNFLYFTSFSHYDPTGFANSFILALILFISTKAGIRHSRGNVPSNDSLNKFPVITV